MNFPLPLDTPIYHFRFKTEITEKDGQNKFIILFYFYLKNGLD